MTHAQCMKLLTKIVSPHLADSIEQKFLVLQDKTLSMKIGMDLTKDAVVIRPFTLVQLQKGLTAGDWSRLCLDVMLILERFPECQTK